MDLLEYQAKKLFRQVGIPVLPSETIANQRDLKQLQIPYPVVLKSQVKVGGRGKAGGVKFVTNTIDAIAAARNIFNLSILGEYPEVILAEARYAAQEELFLAIVLDYQLQCPVIFGSIFGGMDIKPLIENLQQVTIETEFYPFMARRLASQMGLSEKLLLAVSEIVEKMYSLFVTKDLDLIEINPLGVDAEGNLMALDGKIVVNDAALARHPELLNLNGFKTDKVDPNNRNYVSHESSLTEEKSLKKSIQWLDWQNAKGKIALLTNDYDLNLLCWDLIRQQKEKPACAILTEDLPIKEELEELLSQLRSTNRIKVLLLNFWGTEELYLAIAKIIFELQEPSVKTKLSVAGEERLIAPINNSKVALRKSDPKKAESKKADVPSLRLIVRLGTDKIEVYQQEFCHEAIFWTNNLEDAISQAIDFSKAK